MWNCMSHVQSLSPWPPDLVPTFGFLSMDPYPFSFDTSKVIAVRDPKVWWYQPYPNNQLPGAVDFVPQENWSSISPSPCALAAKWRCWRSSRDNGISSSRLWWSQWTKEPCDVDRNPVLRATDSSPDSWWAMGLPNGSATWLEWWSALVTTIEFGDFQIPTVHAIHTSRGAQECRPMPKAHQFHSTCWLFWQNPGLIRSVVIFSAPCSVAGFLMTGVCFWPPMYPWFSAHDRDISDIRWNWNSSFSVRISCVVSVWSWVTMSRLDLWNSLNFIQLPGGVRYVGQVFDTPKNWMENAQVPSPWLLGQFSLMTKLQIRVHQRCSGRDHPDGINNKDWGGGIFWPKLSVFDRFRRRTSKNTVFL